MDYEIAWTEPAEADLEAIVRYLVRRSQAECWPWPIR
jgi:plasmid stabilization system protein ParE